MKKVLIFIDFDDTLVVSAIHFWCNYAKFLQFFYDEFKNTKAENLGLTVPTIAELLKTVERFEAENLPELGFTPTRMACTFEQTFREWNISVDKRLKARFVSLSNTPYDRPLQILPGVEKGLETLSEFAELVVWTRGNTKIQKKRIKSVGLFKYFSTIYALHEKTRIELDKAIDEILGTEVVEIWMIGNSIEHDVMPAREAGINAILIAQSTDGFSWFRNFHIVSNFSEAVEIITGNQEQKTITQMFR